jgi:hypothetical protein
MHLVLLVFTACENPEPKKMTSADFSAGRHCPRGYFTGFKCPALQGNTTQVNVSRHSQAVSNAGAPRLAESDIALSVPTF